MDFHHCDAGAFNNKELLMSREDNLLELKWALHEDFLARKKAWWEWHQKNPQVWLMFERFSFDAVNRGRKKISHWLIINRIRWETAILTTGNDFKISNDYIAFYARLWKAKYPMHADLFNTKTMIGEDDCS